MIDDTVELTITVDVSGVVEAFRRVGVTMQRADANARYRAASMTLPPDDEGVTDARDWAYTARDLA